MYWPGRVPVTSTGRLMRSFLLLLNLVLLIMMVWLWKNAPQVVSMHEAPDIQTPSVQLPGSPLRTLSLDHYQELLARPLFWSERRVLATASPVEALTPHQPLAFVLIGVVTSPQSSYALLGKPGGTEVIKAQPGDVVEGWEIESMTAVSVSLNKSGEKQRIMLDEERGKQR